MEQKMELLENLKNNEEFITKLGAAEDSQSVRKVFGEYGIELTIEEAGAIINYGRECNGELDEESLDEVSGGILVSTLGTWLIYCAVVYSAATFAQIYLDSKSRKKR